MHRRSQDRMAFRPSRAALIDSRPVPQAFMALMVGEAAQAGKSILELLDAGRGRAEFGDWHAPAVNVNCFSRNVA